MSRPFSSRHTASPQSFVRINGRIRAREVRVVMADGEQLGVMSLGEAIAKARHLAVDLVEIAPNANPPVCRLVDYGKYRYEQSKKEKVAKQTQHANKVKEIQLRASIDNHDFDFKLHHAVEFLCEDMKVKVTLRFRGRELAHQEYGFGVVQRFITEVAPFGVPDAPAKKIGRGISVMLSPLPRKQRAANPYSQKAADLIPPEVDPAEPEPEADPEEEEEVVAEEQDDSPKV